MPSERSGRTLVESSHTQSDRPSVTARSGDTTTVATGSIPEPVANDIRAMSLHVSKLRGISLDIRNRLKRQGISYTHQLLREAGSPERRGRLAARGRIDEAALARLVRRADLARVKGIGAIFADMLELVGVDEVARLAEQEPTDLRRRLYELNSAQRLARRAPTPEEVENWVGQARTLPLLVKSR